MMKRLAEASTVERKKVVSITLLFSASIVIMFMGAVLSIISTIHHVYFSVFGSQVHGAVFGIVIVFLGIRYYLSVRKLRTEVYKPTSKFSWGNFHK